MSVRRTGVSWISLRRQVLGRTIFVLLLPCQCCSPCSSTPPQSHPTKLDGLVLPGLVLSCDPAKAKKLMHFTQGTPLECLALVASGPCIFDPYGTETTWRHNLWQAIPRPYIGHYTNSWLKHTLGLPMTTPSILGEVTIFPNRNKQRIRQMKKWEYAPKKEYGNILGGKKS